ncbi:phosphoglycerate kinase [bacterium DOLZORAL124_38_8]|nr:MAG: phosphoglycerate kinase [bacterium DOLZORAL124_38_8]
MNHIQTLDSIQLQDKVVLIRADLNVPIKDGKISENTRVKASLPTIEYCLEHGAKQVHILSHLGRPKGEYNSQFSLEIVSDELTKLLEQPVFFAENFDANTTEHQVVLHENIRFYPGEKQNDEAFIQQILDATKADIFVNDGFGVSHRAHASVVGFAGKIPCVAGKLVESEVEHLSPFLSDKKIAGLTVLVGGAKMETKVAVLKHFARTAENICIGGALANTFLAAKGFDVGESLYEEAEIKTAQEVLAIAEQHQTGFHMPIDVIAADEIDGKALDFPREDISGSLKIFDLGPHTVSSYKEVLEHSKTVIWNGPFGLYEKDAYRNGTEKIAQFLAQNKDLQTILGGGDTLDALKKFSIDQSEYTHVSTGGGAMLEFLEGKKLPGIEVVKK